MSPTGTVLPQYRCHTKKPRTEEVHTPPHAMLTMEEAATQAVHAITQSNNIPTENLYQETIAAGLLQQYSLFGCPVNCGEVWTPDHIHQTLHHGPHSSAHNPDDLNALQEETEEKVRQEYAWIMQWGDMKNKIPKNLRISP
eukprot:9415863-Ditylum_brightwellii.AAC.1